MTIQVQGHVHKVTNSGGPAGQICVHVMFDHGKVKAEGDDCVIFYVPKEDATHWIVGRYVNLTAYAL